MNPTNLVKGQMPDITPPQIVAFVIAGIPVIATLLRAFGVFDLSVEQEKALSDALTWAGVFAAALIGGDAVVRTGRNIRKGNVEAALVHEPGYGPENVEVRNSVLTSVAQPSSNEAPTQVVNPATKLPSKP